MENVAKRDDVKTRLMSVAVATFAEFGWRDSALEHLCARSGVSSSDFYRHYASLDALYLDLYREHSQGVLLKTEHDLAEVLDHMQAEGNDVAARMTSVAVASIASHDDRTWWLLTTEYMIRVVRHPEIGWPYINLRHEFRDAMIQLVGDAMRTAGLAEGVDIPFFVDMTTAMHRGTLAQRFLEPLSSVQGMERLAWSALLTSATTNIG